MQNRKLMSNLHTSLLVTAWFKVFFQLTWTNNTIAFLASNVDGCCQSICGVLYSKCIVFTSSCIVCSHSLYNSLILVFCLCIVYSTDEFFLFPQSETFLPFLLAKHQKWFYIFWYTITTWYGTLNGTGYQRKFYNSIARFLNGSYIMLVIRFLVGIIEKIIRNITTCIAITTWIAIMYFINAAMPSLVRSNSWLAGVTVNAAFFCPLKHHWGPDSLWWPPRPPILDSWLNSWVPILLALVMGPTYATTLYHNNNNNKPERWSSIRCKIWCCGAPNNQPYEWITYNKKIQLVY